MNTLQRWGLLERLIMRLIFSIGPTNNINAVINEFTCVTVTGKV